MTITHPATSIPAFRPGRRTLQGARQQQRSVPQRALVAGVAGVGVASAFEPVAWGWLAPLGVVVLALALRGQSVRGASMIAGVFGLGFMGPLLFWLSASVGPAAWVGVAVAEAAWFALMGAGWSLAGRLPGSPLWLASWWVLIEDWRSAWPFGGFPWGRLGFTAIDTPWSGLLPYAGVTGTGFLLVLGATATAGAMASSGRGRAFTGGVVLVGCLMACLLSWTPAPTGELTVAAVQGGVPGDGTDLVAHHREVTERQVTATVRLARDADTGERRSPDLVVWPENSTAVDPFIDARARAGIQRAADAIGVPLLVGAMVDGPTPDTVLNQSVAWGEDATRDSSYTKRHPVPFGEYIPFRAVIGNLPGRMREVPRDMLAGADDTPMTLAGTAVANAICFDVAYDDVLSPQVRSGARVVVVQTSNASFTGTAQSEQQFAMTRVRAAETGRAALVASTNGVTGAIAPDGSVTSRLAARRAGVLVATLPLVDEVTPAVRYGGWIKHAPGWASAAAVILLAGLRTRERRRRCEVRP